MPTDHRNHPPKRPTNAHTEKATYDMDRDAFHMPMQMPVDENNLVDMTDMMLPNVALRPTETQDADGGWTSNDPRISGTFEGLGTNTSLSVRHDRTATMRRTDDKSKSELNRLTSDFGDAPYWQSQSHQTSNIRVKSLNRDPKEAVGNTTQQPEQTPTKLIEVILSTYYSPPTNLYTLDGIDDELQNVTNAPSEANTTVAPMYTEPTGDPKRTPLDDASPSRDHASPDDGSQSRYGASHLITIARLQSELEALRAQIKSNPTQAQTQVSNFHEPKTIGPGIGHSTRQEQGETLNPTVTKLPFGPPSLGPWALDHHLKTTAQTFFPTQLNSTASAKQWAHLAFCEKAGMPQLIDTED